MSGVRNRIVLVDFCGVNMCNCCEIVQYDLLVNIEHYELCYGINVYDKMLNCEILAVWQLNA